MVARSASRRLSRRLRSYSPRALVQMWKADRVMIPSHPRRVRVVNMRPPDDPLVSQAVIYEDACDERCWAEAVCAVCGRLKQPRGRSVGLEAANSYCDWECRGYQLPPNAPHLWHEHDDARHYIDPNGWAEHVASCESCSSFVGPNRSPRKAEAVNDERCDRDRVTAILTLAEAATEGPWWIEDSDETWVLQGVAFRLAGDDDWPEQVVNKQILKAPKTGTPYAEYWPDGTDAAFIAASRSETPWLARRLLEALDTIDRLEGEMTKLYDAANEYLGNAGKGAPQGIRKDFWDRLADAVTDHETSQALNGGNE